ncbi:MAG: class E sortase [Propionibacteriaceae bacterium]|nr:class E sortase [Propionibacteriaceae bacterium]
MEPASSVAPAPTRRGRLGVWLRRSICLILLLAAPVSGFVVTNLAIQQSWASTIARGEAVAVLRVPRFGDDWAVPILAGTDGAALHRGVGWYTDTSPPGQIGNCVLVGQRLGAGQPFFHLLDLEAGDLILIETADQRLTYVIDTAPRDLTVDRRQSWILDPVPLGVDLVPSQALLSLVTAQDFLPTGDRSVGIAVLTAAEPK